MKALFIAAFVAFITTACVAEETKTEEVKQEAAIKKDELKNDSWQNTTISEATIKKIQNAKYTYNKCVVDEMKKSDYIKADARHATDSIIKSCEQVLAGIRTVYLEEKVPEVVADRHLKQMRIQTTSNVLQQMIFNDAARKSSGQQ